MLSRKISLTNASQKLRAKRKVEMNDMIEKNPDLAKKLKIRDAVGRPRLENDQDNGSAEHGEGCTPEFTECSVDAGGLGVPAGT